jgi:hypothetical protein
MRKLWVLEILEAFALKHSLHARAINDHIEDVRKIQLSIQMKLILPSSLDQSEFKSLKCNGEQALE